MNKKIIAAAIAASFIAPAVIADTANVTVFGKVRGSVDAVDTTGAKNTTSAAVVDNVQANDRASRIGFKGSEDLGNGLKAIFHMEFSANIHSAGGADGLGSRNQFVGLSGDFGTVLTGRHDAPHSLAELGGGVNIFGDTVADMKGTYGPHAFVRASDVAVAYISPSFSGLTAAVALIPSENNAGTGPTSAANGDGLADSVSWGLIYSNGGLRVGLGGHEGDAADTDRWSASIKYKMGDFQVAAVYEDRESGANNDIENFTINGKYTMGNNALKVQFFDSDQDTANLDQDGWAIGLDHNFSKRTQAQVTYVSVDSENNGAGAIEDGDVFSVGLNHTF